MRSRWILGVAAAAALVGSAFGAGGAAYAESMTCSVWLGNSAGCQESYFGQSGGPAWGTVVVVGGQSYAAGWAVDAMEAAQEWQVAHPTNAGVSQAGPSAEPQVESAE
jgi:hypothetical protein